MTEPTESWPLADRPFPKPVTYRQYPELLNAAGVAQARGEKSRAKKLYQKALRQQIAKMYACDPQTRPQDYLESAAWAAFTAMAAGQPEQAARICRQALATQPQPGLLQQILTEQQAIAAARAKAQRQAQRLESDPSSCLR